MFYGALGVSLFEQIKRFLVDTVLFIRISLKNLFFFYC